MILNCYRSIFQHPAPLTSVACIAKCCLSSIMRESLEKRIQNLTASKGAARCCFLNRWSLSANQQSRRDTISMASTHFSAFRYRHKHFHIIHGSPQNQASQDTHRTQEWLLLHSRLAYRHRVYIFLPPQRISVPSSPLTIPPSPSDCYLWLLFQLSTPPFTLHMLLLPRNTPWRNLV